MRKTREMNDSDWILSVLTGASCSDSRVIAGHPIWVKKTSAEAMTDGVLVAGLRPPIGLLGEGLQAGTRRGARRHVRDDVRGRGGRAGVDVVGAQCRLPSVAGMGSPRR